MEVIIILINGDIVGHVVVGVGVGVGAVSINMDINNNNSIVNS